jgi:4-hydroxythreonine-4-phosphate dehydrogenase
VTAPINKYNIQSEEFKFPGHTDYLNQEPNALMLLKGNLRVGLLTDHIRLAKQHSRLTEDLIKEKIETVKQSLDSDLISFKDCCFRLNHCGSDGGVIGKEDDVLKANIKNIRCKGTLVWSF